MKLSDERIAGLRSGEWYCISATGDGAHSVVVPEARLYQSLHDFYCSCSKPWDGCETEDVKNQVMSLDDEEKWTWEYWNYPRPANRGARRCRHIWLDHGEDYTVQVIHITNGLPAALPDLLSDLEEARRERDERQKGGKP